jgi:N-succinyldiaminopimelate aminotransferase
MDDQTFTQALYQYAGVQVVPGSYLSREIKGLNPGKNRVRMALVATEQECTEAAWRIRNYLESLN